MKFQDHFIALRAKLAQVNGYYPIQGGLDPWGGRIVMLNLELANEITRWYQDHSPTVAQLESQAGDNLSKSWQDFSASIETARESAPEDPKAWMDPETALLFWDSWQDAGAALDGANAVIVYEDSRTFLDALIQSIIELPERLSRGANTGLGAILDALGPLVMFVVIVAFAYSRSGGSDHADS